jgi:hypothetical protein
LKLIAAVILKDELSRYLEPCVAHLLEFCDEIRVLDDGSTDGWVETCRGAWGKDGKRVVTTRVERATGEAFLNHAAKRNALTQFALDGWPTHLLAIDADEFVADGAALRRACEGPGDQWQLIMEEVWEACDDLLCVREDGGWWSHGVTMLWRPDMSRRAGYRIADVGHATGRTPVGVSGGPAVGECLHFGWTNKAERVERYARYAVGDGGRFHAKAHIESIMWPDAQVTCRAREWPAALEPWREELLKRSQSREVRQ